MHWIVQNNLLNAHDLQNLRNQLQRFSIPFTEIKVIPFFHIIEPDDIVPEQEHVFVVGSTALGKIARKKGWTPGYFGDNLDYELYIKHYQKHLLNYEAVIGTLGQIEKQWEQFFVRPVTDLKSFSGQVMTWEQLLQMRANVAKVDQEPDATLRLSDKIVMSPLKQIFAKYRFIVVDGKVITGSRYKLGNQVLYSSQVDEYIVDYAQQRVNDWQPNRAFVIDIADTDQGLKVIELNALNSAGYYACDIEKYIIAVEQMQF